MSARRLDFFVIGAMKSGTTSLHHYLRTHPRLYLPVEKEVPFFALERYFLRGMDWYVDECFAKAGDDQLLGTVSPLYMADPRVPARMHSACPGARLIAVLRDPVDRARSHYRMMVRAFDERRSFEHLISEQLGEAELRRLRAPPEENAGQGEDEYAAARKYQSAYVVRGEYGRILRNYLSVYPRDNLLVVYSRDLQTDPAAVMDRIFAFLGVGSGLRSGFERRYHVGAESGLNPIRRLVAGAVTARIRWLRPWAKRIVPAAYRRRLKLWSVMNRGDRRRVAAASTALTPATERRLARHFLDDLATLEAIAEGQPPWKRRLESLAGEHGRTRRASGDSDGIPR